MKVSFILEKLLEKEKHLGVRNFFFILSIISCLMNPFAKVGLAQVVEQSQPAPAAVKPLPAKVPMVAEDGAVSTSRLALPFKKIWQYLDDTTTLAPSVDEARIYLPLAQGRVICLDRASGSRVWMDEVGGQVSASVAIGESAVFIATRKFADDGSEAGAALRAVDKLTGLTLWARDYPRPFTSSFAISGKRLYAGNADGSLYALSADDGAIIWQAKTSDVIRSRPLVFESVIYFGSDDGALRGVEMDNGHEVFKFQSKGKIACTPVIDEKYLYLGSGDGQVYALERLTGKLKWQTRTGAGIETSPVLIGDQVLVASFDNFIYAIAKTTGNKIWKRRFENRLTATPIVEGDAVLIAPFRGDHIAVFLNSDGRRVNFYQLDKGNEIVAQPVFTDNLLVIATDKGLIVAQATLPTDTNTNALKKPKP
ncbi:MAG: PQQ-binding-like beta-propeller repeat protein [Acidobacteriota bacterium]